MTSPNSGTPPDAQPVETAKKNGKSLTLWSFSVLLFLAALTWLLLWVFYFQYYETTDDAYVNGNMVRISSVVEGSVVSYAAEDTYLVREGQLLVQLDETNYRVSYEKELSTLAVTMLEVRQMYDRVSANRAHLESQKSVLSKAKYDYENRVPLALAKAVSNEDLVHAQDDLLFAQFQVQQAEYELRVSMDAVGTFAMVDHPLIQQQRAKVREAFYKLKHCSIYAPCTGYVAQRSVQVGQSVLPTTALMSVIPENYLWVDANFKETQLPYMRIGQPAEVWLDLYGSRVLYKGTVLGIASGTGSIFSLLPPQNATGNWIKIVQRLPVRISLDPEVLRAHPGRLGLSAYVKVDLSEQQLPLLAQAPSAQPPTKTSVFEISFSEVNLLMDQLAAELLNSSPSS
jgi:membrane fusion protein, multidrug efflux system